MPTTPSASPCRRRTPRRVKTPTTTTRKPDGVTAPRAESDERRHEMATSRRPTSVRAPGVPSLHRRRHKDARGRTYGALMSMTGIDERHRGRKNRLVQAAVCPGAMPRSPPGRAVRDPVRSGRELPRRGRRTGVCAQGADDGVAESSGVRAAQLSSMHSGRASKDLYARVFVPLMHEFEEASLQYRAVMAKDSQRRQEERRPAAPTRRHRRSTWPQLHRSVNLSG